MEITKENTCCFTGHRFIPIQDSSKISLQLYNIISDLAEENISVFISGGAIGFDLLAAQTVISVRNSGVPIKLIMALPCNEQDKLWSKSNKLLYRNTLDMADEIIYVSEKYRTGCMHLRNKFMVNNSSVCIAYLVKYNSGTANTVNYARDENVRIIKIEV